jgi:hypothetical protein
VHTPGQKTIEDVARFLGVSQVHTIKTLAMMITKVEPENGQSSHSHLGARLGIASC